METAKLKKFAQYARRYLIDQVTVKMEFVLASESTARRECSRAVRDLEEQLRKTSNEQVVEKVAYTWFNRFCALRFMDVNRYTRIGIVSPAEGQFQPEILAEAKMGHIDEEIVPDKIRQQVFALLNGMTPSRDPQQEAYRLLIVAACNYYHTTMKFLFEKIDDYTELLMPDDLLSGTSILTYTREAMTPDACEDVEVIGWLYQFYISEKKDEVFEGLKKNKKITPENIPAATQLFTPHWIVRYLVENSLGRLWMLNRPGSRLIEQMDYYIKPEQPETDFLKVTSPEEIKICDPACGSGHMLVYAFDLLHAIYEEEGYEPSEIPEKILTNNLYGIEIDERAGVLAAFALTMKARSKNRQFFRKGIQPNICVLDNIHFEADELKAYMDEVGHDLFTTNLYTTLRQFEEADNFGSLIRPTVTDAADTIQMLDVKKVAGNLFLSKTNDKVLQVLKQADYLSPKYHVVVANPPYMGGKGMNGRLKSFLQDNYADVKSDLFSAFIVRNTELALPKGQLGYMSPFVWMFISSYEKLRDFLISKKTITSLVQLEYSGFDGATVPVCTFTLENSYHRNFKGGYIRLSDFRGAENQGPKTLWAIKNPSCGWFYRASAADFKKIPGSPIAYWVSERIWHLFGEAKYLGDFATPKIGMRTGDNERFLRFWFEVESKDSYYPHAHSYEKHKDFKWIPYNKGGAFRKWYGNFDYFVNWENDGHEIRENTLVNYPQLTWDNLGWKISNEPFYFREGITWTGLSSSRFGVRYLPEGFIFDTAGPCLFGDNLDEHLAFLTTKQCFELLKILNPTLHFNNYNIAALPVVIPFDKRTVRDISWKCVDIARADWNSYEISWDFTALPLLQPAHLQPTLKEIYTNLRAHWLNTTLEMQRLEEENNRIFIEAYGLQDELTPEVPLNEITLTCNPHYRYGNNRSDEELEALLKADTLKEFISYAVGCMFGRYSLDKPGLILANQGETIEDYLKQVPEPTFPADTDNVIPILDGDWFTDDISERFRKFLRVTFGDERYEDNLKFIESALGKDIRKYFLKDFYNDHVRRYKKRPIYWLFSSPKGSFNALIYLHRYRPDTVSVVLNDYLREFRSKLVARKNQMEGLNISASASQAEKTRALKEIENIKKMIEELQDYERDVLYPLATEQIDIDLDDGVKVNYVKFGLALKKVPGLDAKEE